MGNQLFPREKSQGFIEALKPSNAIPTQIEGNGMKCGKCGADNATNMVKCGNCGHPLSSEPQSHTTEHVKSEDITRQKVPLISEPQSHTTEHVKSEDITCQKCGHQNLSYLVYCGMCGSDLGTPNNLQKPDMKKCRSCGRPIPRSGGDICWECGHPTYSRSALSSNETGEPKLLLAGAVLLMIAGAMAIAEGVLLIAIERMIATTFHASAGVFVLYGALAILSGVVAIGGGFFAVKRERFVLTIIGSVCAILGLGFSIGLVLAILALVFIAVSKDEFLS